MAGASAGKLFFSNNIFFYNNIILHLENIQILMYCTCVQNGSFP